MDEALIRLLDKELITYREAYILDEYNNKHRTCEQIAQDLCLTRQRVAVIKDKVENRLTLPYVKAIYNNKPFKHKKYNLGNIGLSEGVVIKLYTYGIYNLKDLCKLSINQLSSISGISKNLAIIIFGKVLAKVYKKF